MRAVLFLTRALSLSHRDRKRKSETSKSKRSDEFPMKLASPQVKKRYEKSEILEQRELAKTLARVDVFDWSLSRRVFDISSREGVEARPVESGRLEERIER